MGCVGWVVWVHGLCRLGGVGTWVVLLYAMSRLKFGAGIFF